MLDSLFLDFVKFWMAKLIVEFFLIVIIVVVIVIPTMLILHAEKEE